LRINQRRQVETDNIHLQVDSVGILNHGAYDQLASRRMNLVTIKQGITTYCRWIARAAIGSRGPGNQEKRSEDECGPRPDGPESFRAVRLSPFHPKQRLVKGKGFS